MSLLLDDLMAPEVINDPHAYYHQLRESDPVHYNERWGGWILTGYDDVVEVLRDAQRFVRRRCRERCKVPQAGRSFVQGGRCHRIPVERYQGDAPDELTPFGPS